MAARAGRPTSEEADIAAKANKPGRADYLAVKAALQERLLDEIGERGLLENEGADVAAASRTLRRGRLHRKTWRSTRRSVYDLRRS